jgi:hypothetical protein
VKDSVTIAGIVLLILSGVAVGYLWGRGDRRTIYTPGPPVLEPEATMPIIERMSREESVRLVPRYPSKPLPPPIADGWSSPEEKAYWMDLHGDPTKPKGPVMNLHIPDSLKGKDPDDPVLAKLIEAMLKNVDDKGKLR